MSDLKREIRKRLVAHAGHPLFLEHEDAVRAISAVLDAHSPWESEPWKGRCTRCAGQSPCSTVRVIAGALGVREDGE